MLVKNAVHRTDTLPFDERMMKMLADPTLKAECWREAALNLARLGKPRESYSATIYNGIAQREIDRKKPNPAIIKFRKPTVAEAILSALDQEMKTIDSKDREGVSEYDFQQIAFPYLEALYELGDGRITAELAKRSRTSKGRMRWALAFICHSLQDPGPLATFAKEFERGKVNLPAEKEGEEQLREIVKYLTAAGTKEADGALFALTDRKHPAYNVARRAVLTDRPDPFLGEVWVRHPYCLTILRQALEDTTPTGSTYKVEGKMVMCYERRNVLAGGSWSSSEHIPGTIDDPKIRNTEAMERVCDVVAMKLQTLVFGINPYHPLLKDREKRLTDIKAFLDRFNGRLQRLNGAPAKLLGLGPATICFLPDIPPLNRPATAEDVKACRAVFHLGGKGKFAAQRLPATALLEGIRVLIVQAEIGPDGTVTYGVISHDGLRAVPAGKLSDIRTKPK